MTGNHNMTTPEEILLRPIVSYHQRRTRGASSDISTVRPYCSRCKACIGGIVLRAGFDGSKLQPIYVLKRWNRQPLTPVEQSKKIVPSFEVLVCDVRCVVRPRGDMTRLQPLADASPACRPCAAAGSRCGS